jgi:cytochrome c-type biogenesis protein CcmH
MWGALAVVVIVAVVALVVRSRPNNSVSARTERLEHQLACPVCQGESVADSDAPESRAIRADIPLRIRAGQTDAQIRAAYVATYGQKILLSPTNSGIDLVAWIVPSIAILLGAFGIAFALRRWSRAPRLAATEEDERIVEEARGDA